MRRIGVFCGSTSGNRPEFAEAARALARAMAARGHGLVYGGGNVGLMGVVADAMLAAGGEVVGVIPHSLMTREIGHTGVTTLHVVDSMHERKALMADLADAFIALPGGIGTFEEWFEAVTWTQLGLHRKPYGLFDVNEFFAPLLGFLDHAVTEGFIRHEYRDLLVVDTQPAELIRRMEAMAPPALPRWLDRATT